LAELIRAALAAVAEYGTIAVDAPFAAAAAAAFADAAAAALAAADAPFVARPNKEPIYPPWHDSLDLRGILYCLYIYFTQAHFLLDTLKQLQA
jgi:hypothetical protein